jgi:cytochrome c553
MRLLMACALVATSTLCLNPARAADKPARLGLCAGCHGEDGRAVAPGAPNLAGQNLDYLRSAAAQYLAGTRTAPAMRAALGMLSPAELDRVLVWYAQAPAREATAP